MWTGISTFFTEIDWSGIWDGLWASATDITKKLADKLNPANWFGGNSSGTTLENKGVYQGMGSIDYSQYGLTPPVQQANGGMVFGPGSETSDSIPALLSNGEFVVNAKSTRKNRALLESLNSNRYAAGGLVDGNSDIIKRIKKEESWKSTAYLDSLDKPTIGYGRLLSNKTMTQSEMKKKFGHLKETEAQSLQNAIDYVNKTAVPDARKFVGSKNYDGLASNVQDALISAAYNIGGTKLSKFAKFRKALVSKNNPDAAFQLLDSNAATQAVFRYAELAQLILDGKNPKKLPKRYLKTLIKRKQAKLPIPDGYGSFVSKYEEGGHVRGAGSGTSDSIPALLSNGEFVVRASQASKHAELLKSINTPGFAEGTATVDSFRGDNSTITKLLIKAANKQIQSLKQNNKLFTKMIARDANSEKILFDDEDRVDAEATIAMFAKYFKDDEDARDNFIQDMRKLQKYSTDFSVAKVDIRNRDSFVKLNEEIKLAIEQKRAEYTENEKILKAKRAENLKSTITGTGDTVDGFDKKNEFEGFGQSLTQPFKDAVARGDFKSVGDAIGEGIRSITQRITSKMLDRAFASLEQGIDSWLMSVDKMEVEGEGMFARLGMVFTSILSSIGSGIFGLFGGSMPTFGGGGEVRGAGTGTSDSIPARLSNGEFVVKASQAKKHKSLLETLNGGGNLANVLKMLIPGAMFLDSQKNGGILSDFLVGGGGNNMVGSGGAGKDGLFARSTLGGIVPDLPTRPVMERGRGFQTLNNGATGGFDPSIEDYNRAEGRRTNLLDRLLTTKARKDELAQLTTKQRAAFEAGVSQKDSRGRFNHSDEVLSRITGGVLGTSKAQKQNAAMTSIVMGKTSNWTTKDGKSIAGVSNSFAKSDSKKSRSRFSGTSQSANKANRAIDRTSNNVSKAAGVQQTFRQTSSGSYAGGFANGGVIRGAGTGTSDSIMARVSNGEFVVNAKATKDNLGLLTKINGGNPKSSVPKFATGGEVSTSGNGGDGAIYLTIHNNYDVQSAMNPQEFQAMMANNSELTFLSVEKKLRETGRSLYK